MDAEFANSRHDDGVFSLASTDTPMSSWHLRTVKLVIHFIFKIGKIWDNEYMLIHNTNDMYFQIILGLQQ